MEVTEKTAKLLRPDAWFFGSTNCDKDAAMDSARTLVKFILDNSAYPDMLSALKSAIELSDRMLTDAGRADECQAVYDECVLAVRKAEGR